MNSPIPSVAKRVFVRNYWYENMMSPLQSFTCDFHDFHGKRFAVVTNTYGTTQNHAKPAKTTQIHPQYTLIRPVCAILALMAVCVMLRDYHVEIFSTLDIVFYFAIKNFALKLSRKVKVFSLAENKQADIFLQLRLMSSQN